MLKNDYRFALEFRALDGRDLGRLPCEADWEPACEWTRFEAWRKAPDTAAPATDTTLEPVYQPAGGPYASGFRVAVSRDGQQLGAGDFPLTYFAPQARAGSAALVQQGRLQDGERYYYRLLAFPRSPEEAPKPAAGFTVVEIVRPPRTRPGSFAALAAQATPCGEPVPGALPVFIDETVLAEADALTEQTGAAETGGILIGHLCRDASLPDLGVVVTAQIPARHAEGALHRLTFTPQTWAAVEAALALRRSDEIMLGWWHSHPAKFWWAQRPPPEDRAGALRTNFFSDDDRCVHETVFPRPFQIALVVTNTDVGLTHALFGWRAGLIQPRGFQILNTTRPVPAVPAAGPGETPHASLGQ